MTECDDKRKRKLNKHCRRFDHRCYTGSAVFFLRLPWCVPLLSFLRDFFSFAARSATATGAAAATDGVVASFFLSFFFFIFFSFFSFFSCFRSPLSLPWAWWCFFSRLSLFDNEPCPFSMAGGGAL